MNKPCWRCTSVGHLPDNCFAIDKLCHRCQTKGHIQRACTQQGVKRESLREEREEIPPKARKISAITAEMDGQIVSKDYQNDNFV